MLLGDGGRHGVPTPGGRGRDPWRVGPTDRPRRRVAAARYPRAQPLRSGVSWRRWLCGRPPRGCASAQGPGRGLAATSCRPRRSLRVADRAEPRRLVGELRPLDHGRGRCLDGNGRCVGGVPALAGRGRAGPRAGLPTAFTSAVIPYLRRCWTNASSASRVPWIVIFKAVAVFGTSLALLASWSAISPLTVLSTSLQRTSPSCPHLQSSGALPPGRVRAGLPRAVFSFGT
jgi:hypothetical protein